MPGPGVGDADRPCLRGGRCAPRRCGTNAEHGCNISTASMARAGPCGRATARSRATENLNGPPSMALQPDESGLRRLDLNLLPVFAALMRERSVTRAGQALFLSQPAASAALARLRAAFRDELLVRNGRALEPTPRAEALLAELEPALRAVAGAVAGATP